MSHHRYPDLSGGLLQRSLIASRYQPGCFQAGRSSAIHSPEDAAMVPGEPPRLLAERRVASEQPGPSQSKISGQSCKQGQVDDKFCHRRRCDDEAAGKGVCNIRPSVLESMVVGMQQRMRDCIANKSVHIGKQRQKQYVVFSLHTGHECRVRLIMRHPVSM